MLQITAQEAAEERTKVERLWHKNQNEAVVSFRLMATFTYWKIKFEGRQFTFFCQDQNHEGIHLEDQGKRTDKYKFDWNNHAFF